MTAPGSFRVKKTVIFSGPLLPLPPGYRVTRQERAQSRPNARRGGWVCTIVTGKLDVALPNCQ